MMRNKEKNQKREKKLFEDNKLSLREMDQKKKKRIKHVVYVVHFQSKKRKKQQQKE